MRILVVQESDWLEKGPHQSHHLMERLSLRGHEIRVIDFEILWRRNNQKGIVSHRMVVENFRKATNDGRITVIRPLFLRIPLLDYVSMALSHMIEIARQIEEFKPDVVIGFGILNASIAIRMTKKRKIPFVYYIIDELHRLVPQRSLQGLACEIERRNMSAADLVISISDALRDYSIEMGALAERSVIVKAGIDLERFGTSRHRDIIRRQFGFKNTDIVLLYIGWLYEFSGMEEVTTEIALRKEQYVNVRLLVVGEGEIGDELRRIRNEHKAEDIITILDWQPYERIPGLIAASDICLLPAQSNAIMRNIVPIKMYEYMAAGKPVIATRLFGLIKEFGTSNGVIYVDSPHEVLPRAVTLAGSGGAAAIGKSARDFVAQSDWMKIVSDFEDIIRRLV